MWEFKQFKDIEPRTTDSSSFFKIEEWRADTRIVWPVADLTGWSARCMSGTGAGRAALQFQHLKV